MPSRPAWDAGPTAPATHRAAGASASARVLAAAIALVACSASCAPRGWRVPRLPLPPPARPPTRGPALVALGAHTHPAGMFVVTEAEAAMIRAAFEQHGEFSAAVELRRLFPAIT